MTLTDLACRLFVERGISTVRLILAGGDAILVGANGRNTLVFVAADDLPRSALKVLESWRGAITTIGNPEQALALADSFGGGE